MEIVNSGIGVGFWIYTFCVGTVMDFSSFGALFSISLSNSRRSKSGTSSQFGS